MIIIWHMYNKYIYKILNVLHQLTKKKNRIIFNRLSVIQNQHRQIFVGHPIHLALLFYLKRSFQMLYETT